MQIKRNQKSRRQIKNLEDEYLKQAELGQGSYGKVYKCIQKKSGQEFAVKEISKRGIRHEKGWIYINNEIEILRSLKQEKCENIVKFHEALETELHIYIVLELCEITLRRHVAQNPPDEKFVVEVVVDGLFNIITVFKKNNIIHRDIKDQNLMIKNGVLKIIDFGISVLNTTARSCMGTPNYMAPEIGGGDSETYGEQVDIWSAGVVLLKIVDKLPRDFRFNVKKLRLTSIKIGTINYSQELKNFIESCLVVVPNRREYEIFKREYQVLRGRGSSQTEKTVRERIHEDSTKSLMQQYNQCFEFWELFLKYEKQLHNEDKKYYFYLANFFFSKFLRVKVDIIHEKLVSEVTSQISSNMRLFLKSINQAQVKFSNAIRTILRKLNIKFSSSLALQLSSSVIVKQTYFYQTMTQTAINHFLDLYEDLKGLSALSPELKSRRAAVLDYLHFYKFFLTPDSKDMHKINSQNYRREKRLLILRNEERVEQVLQEQIDSFISKYFENSFFKQDKLSGEL